VANNFLRQLFGGTEPSYAGLRVPRQMMQDDSRLIRLGNPQERFRDYHSPDMFDRTKSPIGSDVLGLAPLSEEDKVDIQGGVMEAPLVETPEQKAKAKKAQQDMIRGIGSDLASMFAQSQEPSKPLQFAQLQQQQLIPLIDPRFRRAKGGKVKKGQPYLVGEEGVEVVVPEEDSVVLPNPSTVDEEARKFGGNRANFAPQEEVTETQVETPTTDAETFTETPEPSIADLLRSKIDERQKRLAEGATKNPDGTTTYGGQKYRKRNALDALKSAGLGALQSLANMQVNPNDPNPLSSMFGRAIGGAGAGAVMGATMNNVDERMVDKMKLAQLLPQYQQAYGMERQKKADDTAEIYKQAQIRNLDDDNKRLGDVAKQTMLDRKRKAWHSTHKFFDPAKATVAEKRQLAEFNETPESIGLYDFTKPDRKVVGGVTFAWNPNTKSFEDAGLPKDKSKEIIDYTVTDKATGVKTTYSVTSDKAATLKTQLEAAGMQIEAAEKRQISQQNFQGQQNEADRVIRQEQFIANYALKVADDARQAMDRANAAGATAQSKADAKAQWKVTEINKIKAALAEKKLDEETANQMINAVENQ